MSKISSELVDNAIDFVIDLFEKNLPTECVFHTKDHTIDVFRNSQLIGKKEGLSEEEMNILGIAAVFHDAGYIKDYDKHEGQGAKIASEFLRSRGLENLIILQVERAILATEVPQKPMDKISMVLCDADLMHLGSDDYFERMEPLREEWKLTGRYNLSELEFHKSSLDFYALHHYHTNYGKSILAPKKEKTLNLIMAEIKKKEGNLL